MRITKRNLNLLIESLLNEEEHAIPDADPKGKNLDPREGDILDKAKAADNPKAVKVPPSEAAEILKRMNVPVPKGDYFVWLDWDLYWAPEIGVKPEFGKAGSDYGISGRGDPYTYAKVGDRYRIISGPVSKSVGKTFKPQVKEPEPEPPINAILEFIEDSELYCDNYPEAAGEYKEVLAASAIATLDGDKNALVSIGERVRASQREGSFVSQQRGILRVFSSECGTTTAASMLHDGVLQMLLDAGAITYASKLTPSASGSAKVASTKDDDIEFKSNPESVTSRDVPPSGQPETRSGMVGPDTDINEGLSRGSLYRRRYHGRY